MHPFLWCYQELQVNSEGVCCNSKKSNRRNPCFSLCSASEVIQEPLPSKPWILVKKSVVSVKLINGFTKTIAWTENPGKIRRRAF